MEQVTPSAKNPGYRIIVLTALALLAFAGNSVLCRLALKGDLIGAGFFTAVRITTGAVALWVFVSLRGSGLAATRSGGSLQASAFLAVYMVAFSFAYLELSTGTGALLLFGAVQVTMIGWAITQGDRPNAGQWMGLIVALGGLAWLLAPGAEAPFWAQEHRWLWLERLGEAIRCAAKVPGIRCAQRLAILRWRFPLD